MSGVILSKTVALLPTKSLLEREAEYRLCKGRVAIHSLSVLEDQSNNPGWIKMETLTGKVVVCRFSAVGRDRCT